MVKFIVEAGFSQFVDFATRGGNILDVILSDDDQIITAVSPNAIQMIINLLGDYTLHYFTGN